MRKSFLLLAILPALMVLVAAYPQTKPGPSGVKDYGPSGYSVVSSSSGQSPGGSAFEATEKTWVWCFADSSTDHDDWVSNADRYITDPVGGTATGAGDSIAYCAYAKAVPNNSGAYRRADYALWHHGAARPANYPDAAEVMTIIWFDLDPLRTAAGSNATIVSAELCFVSFEAQAGIEGIYVGLDTFSTNEAWLSSADNVTDNHIKDACWNYADLTNTTAWAMAMDDQDEYWENGIPSEFLDVPTDALAEDEELTVDVTKSVQMWLTDNLSNAGFRFLLKKNYNSASHFRCGPDAGNDDKRPFLKVTWSDAPYSKPWNDKWFAMILSTDDTDTCNLTWADTAMSYGYPMTIYVNEVFVDSAESWVMSWSDVDHLINEGHEVQSHTRWHGYHDYGLKYDSTHGLLAWTTIDSVLIDMERTLLTSNLTAMTDTNEVVALAFPRGYHSLTTDSLLSILNYQHARCTESATGGINGDVYVGNGIGDASRHIDFSADTSNVYAIKALRFQRIVGDSNQTTLTKANITARLDSLKFDSITNDWRLMYTYFHDQKGAGPYKFDGPDYDEFGLFFQAVDDAGDIWIDKATTVIQHWKRRATPVDPPTGSKADSTSWCDKSKRIWWLAN